METPPNKKLRVETNSVPEVYFKLQGSTGEPVKISKGAIRHMKTMEEMTLYLDIDESTIENMEPFEVLGGISEPVLCKIVHWCEYHKEDTEVKDDELNRFIQRNSDQSIPTWDKDFLEMSKADLFKLAKAVDYLNIDLLQDYIAEKIAREVDDKNTEEMLKYFQLP